MFEGIAYGAILSAHIAAFMANVVMVVVADLTSLLWVLGKRETAPRRLLTWLHRLLSIGLAVSIVTGALLFWEARDYLLAQPAMYTKFMFVAALVVNAFVIGTHMQTAFTRPFFSLTAAEKRPLFISGAVSTVSWIGVVVSAQFLGL